MVKQLLRCVVGSAILASTCTTLVSAGIDFRDNLLPQPMTIPLRTPPSRSRLAKRQSLDLGIDVNVDIGGADTSTSPIDIDVDIRIADIEALGQIREYLAAKYASGDALARRGLAKRRERSKRELQTVSQVADSVQKVKRQDFQTPASQPLTPYVLSKEEIDFMGQVQIGTPPQTFDLIVDTGSSDIWVQSSACLNCSTGATMDTHSSSTLASKNQTFEIVYGIGQTSGIVYTDTISVANKSIAQQTFAIANQMSADWTSNPASGLFGMGFLTNSKTGGQPFFQNLVAQRVIPEAVFSFAMGSTKRNTQNISELTLGGTDSSKYTGNVSYIPVADPRFYWELELASLNIGGSPAVTFNNSATSSKHAIIDTGSSLVAGPKADVDAFWAHVPNATYVPSGAYWTYPCDAQLNTSFSFSAEPGQSFIMSEDDLNFGRVNAFSENCVGAIIEGNTSGYWILGVAFLKNWYSVFDAANYQIGFAQPTY